MPVLYLPSSEKAVAHPVTVLLWALGSLDRYFLEGEAGYLDNAGRASRWLVDNVLPAGYWETGISASDRSHEYYSGNGCMNQGLALSFLARILQNQLLDPVSALNWMRLLAGSLRPCCSPLNTAGRPASEATISICTSSPAWTSALCFNGWVFGLFGFWTTRAGLRIP